MSSPHRPRSGPGLAWSSADLAARPTGFWRLLAALSPTVIVAILIDLVGWTGVWVDNPAVVLHLCILVAAFLGGMWTGLVSAVIVSLYAFIYYLTPVGAPSVADGLQRALLISVMAPLLATLAGVLRQRTQQVARLEGVLLAARTVQHEMSNHLAVTVGSTELLAQHAGLPGDLQALADEALRAAVASGELLKRLQALERVQEVAWGTGLESTLRLPAPAAESATVLAEGSRA